MWPRASEYRYTLRRQYVESQKPSSRTRLFFPGLLLRHLFQMLLVQDAHLTGLRALNRKQVMMMMMIMTTMMMVVVVVVKMTMMTMNSQ